MFFMFSKITDKPIYSSFLFSFTIFFIFFIFDQIFQNMLYTVKTLVAVKATLSALVILQVYQCVSLFQVVTKFRLGRCSPHSYPLQKGQACIFFKTYMHRLNLYLVKRHSLALTLKVTEGSIFSQSTLQQHDHSLYRYTEAVVSHSSYIPEEK